MIIWVDDLLFQEGAREVDRLALLRGAAIRRHTLIVSTDPTAARAKRVSPGFDAWAAELPLRLKAEVTVLRCRLDLVSGNATAHGGERLLVSRRPRLTHAHGCWVTVEEAVRAVVLPTYILVENGINDRAFLRRAMPPPWQERLDGWERAGLLRYENGGGNSVMCAIIERHLDDAYAKDAFGLPTRLWRLVHVAVYDHDGTDAEHPGDGAKALTRACRSANLDSRSHRLHRRDQEHYLPKGALEAVVRLSITNVAERERLLAAIEVHMNLGSLRHFSPLPTGADFKNAFEKDIDWSDAWFRDDGAWPEMTILAEKIAASI